MDTLKIESVKDYAIVRLDRGRGNAINHQMVKEIRQAFKQLGQDDAVRGVILTGKPGFFSVGLDLLELYYYDEEQIIAFWWDWYYMVFELASFHKPFLTAINGHSPAGGCVLAICSDYRIMVEGDRYRIGLNEVAVGIRLPDYIFQLFSFWVGKRRAYQNLLEGKLLTVQEAYDQELIDEVCTEEMLMDLAHKKMRKWLQAADPILQASKVNIKSELIERIDVDMSDDMEKRVKEWFHPQARAVMGVVVQQLEARKKD